VPIVEPLLRWYAGAARDLPWRRPGTGAWGVLVSEVMLQQTPVNRVLPVYSDWVQRWPRPQSLAVDGRGEAVRMWGRLGYPRRALRLHESAVAIVERHAGAVPADLDALLALPGVGAYTARAVATFGYGRRHAVVDTNVRRVAARLVLGQERAPTSAADLALVEPLVPAEPAAAARFAAALMELGALVCTARSPRCPSCPLAQTCAWRRAGRPASDAPRRRAQPYAGTDRQVRGVLLGRLRLADGPVDAGVLAGSWPDELQRDQALASLLADGLVARCADGSYALP